MNNIDGKLHFVNGGKYSYLIHCHCIHRYNNFHCYIKTKN